jgi:hypothetical protein
MKMNMHPTSTVTTSPAPRVTVGNQPSGSHNNASTPPGNLVTGAGSGGLLAPLPANILSAYSFNDRPARRFTRAGLLSPADTRGEQQVQWDEAEKSVIAPKFHDSHCHMHDYTGAGHSIAEVVSTSMKLGIPRFTMIPIPTTLVSCHNDRQTYLLYGESSHCGEAYYVPREMADLKDLSEKTLQKIQEGVELRVDPSVDINLARQVADAVKYGKIKPEHLDRMDLALTGIHLGSRRICKDILKSLHNIKEMNDDLTRALQGNSESMAGHRLRFTHIGEVTLRKEIVETLFAGKTQANLKTNISPTREAMRLAGIIGMPWILHCDVDKPESLKSKGEKNRTPIHLDYVKALMRSCPNTEIIWAHAGGLGRFVKESSSHLAELEALMEDPTLNHVNLDISWSVVAQQLTRDSESLEQWAKFMAKYHERIFFGSDTLTPQTHEKWTETYDIYTEGGLFRRVDKIHKDEIHKDEIHQDASKHILFDNYDRIFVAARERVDCFTDHVLPLIIEGVQSIDGPENIDLESLQAQRDKIYAQVDGTDARVHRARTYFAERDRALPIAEPAKPRKHELRKGVLNFVTFGKYMQNYKLMSGRSGDFIANRRRRAEARNLEASVRKTQERIRELSGALTPETSALLTKREQNMKSAIDNLDTVVPPDAILQGIQSDLAELRNRLDVERDAKRWAEELNAALDQVMGPP